MGCGLLQEKEDTPTNENKWLRRRQVQPTNKDDWFQEERSNQPNFQRTDMNFPRNNSCFIRNNTVISCNFNDKFEELFNNYSVDS